MNKKNFYICRNDTIAEIQSSFSRFFPMQAINFFSNSEKNNSNDSCVMFSPEVRVRDISPECQDGCIELSNSMTTDDLEKLVHDCFGLHVEISAKATRQTNSVFQKLSWSSRKKNPERVRSSPGRSYASYFRDMPYGC